MSSERHQKVSDLFRAACELAPDARTAFLDQACAKNPEVRAEVEALLAHDDQHPSFLEETAPTVEQQKTPPPPMALNITAHVASHTLILDQLIVEALMIPLNVVVLSVFLHNFAKMALAQRNGLGEALRLD